MAGRVAGLLVLRKLAVTRQLYLDAARQRVRPTATSRLIAVIEYDAAIETAVKTALADLMPKKVPSGELPALIERLDASLSAAMATGLPRPSSAHRVRSIRNAGQHEGRLPTPEELDECHILARGFLEDLVSLAWGLSFDSIGLVDLIEDERARALLHESQAALSAGEFRTCVEKAGEALDGALMRVKNALVGRTDPFSRGILVEESGGRAKVSRDLTSSVQRTQQTVLYLALGLDYGDLVRFKAVAGESHFTIGGGAVHVGLKDSLDAADAESAFAYASEAVVQIEAAVGSLDRPFGRDHWF